jgi:hypothetical protein
MRTAVSFTFGRIGTDLVARCKQKEMQNFLKKTGCYLGYGLHCCYTEYMNTTTSNYGKGWESNSRSTSATSPTIRNRVAYAVLLQAQAKGHADISQGMAQCALCGEWERMANIEMGHIVPASTDMGWCHPMNLLPMCAECNGELGDEDPTVSYVLKYDTRNLWEGTLPVLPEGVKNIKKIGPVIRDKWNTK